MTFENLLILIAAIVAAAMSFVFIKKFKEDAPISFAATRMLFMTIVFIIAFFTLGGAKIGVDFSRIWLFLGGAAAFVFCNLFAVLATKEGPLSYTSLIFSFGLFIPTFYGVLFANESVGLFFWIGLVLFVACLLLINIEPKKKSEQKPKIKITLKWIIYVLIGTVSNGIASILISLAGVQGEGATNGVIYDGIVFFMISCIIASIVTVSIALITEKDKIKQAKTSLLKFASSCGVFTAVLYAAILVITNLKIMPISIFFPVYSGGQLILCSVIGITCFKEKYRLLQYVGLALGISSVILLNL